jgi:regulator of cell morphogenesis and NO signaling
MQDLNAKTIREIALEYPQTTRVFEEFKIDYCCGGRKPLAEACRTAGADPQILRRRLEEAVSGNTADEKTVFPENMKPAELINHIVDKHHVYTNREIERLTPLMEKVCDRHGSNHLELSVIRKLFRTLADELTVHMRKEETVLFPYIRVLDAVFATDLPVAEPHFKTVRNPVRMMISEHDAAGDLLRRMREASNGYATPEGACPSFRALYFGLEELEKDLHRHIHLENNVLFPQALELEDKVSGTKTNAEFAGSDACQTSSCG